MPRYLSRILIIYFWPLVLAWAVALGITAGLYQFFSYCSAAWKGQL